MRAVNLIPRDARRAGVSPSLAGVGAAHVVVGLLVVALAFVTVYVLTYNTVSQRESHLATLQQQVAQAEAQAARLSSYQQFEKLAQARAATVRQLAATRFDWHGALSDLSKVVPANTSLQSLAATVAPGSTTGSTAGSPAPTAGTGGSVRGDINAPALELKGCTATQDDVARLMSRLRLINGVTRVTLEDSAKATAGVTGAAAGSSAAPGQASCSGGPSFDMVVFFQPMAAPTTGTGAPSTSTGVAK